MKQLPGLALSLVVFVSAVTNAGWSIDVSASQAATIRESSKPAGASLIICLRLADDRPFLGTANLRVMPNEGYELTGGPTESEGQFIFAGVDPGTYIVEVSAPGFLAQRLRAQVEERSGQKSIIVIMKPRPIQELAIAISPETQGGNTTKPPGENGIALEAAKSTPTARDYWTAHELEEFVPPVDGSVPCPSQSLLNGVGQRMVELIANLEKFSAIEQVEHFTVEGKTPRSIPERRTFDYVVAVSRNVYGTFMLEEYRNGKEDPDQFPAHLATLGLPGLALLFHPELSRDFAFECEGLGQLGGRAAWQVHFAQRADRQVRMRSYSVDGRVFRVRMQGRAWIDPGTYQLMRLESELENPISEIGLTIEHTSIDYEPVQFRTQKIQIWLPQRAELYVDRKGHRYYRKHTFTDFRIFNVDTAQKVERPKESYTFTNLSNQDIAGVLAVLPTDQTKHDAVTVNFTVPALGKVVKVVGIGKDVDLPITEVASATFKHNGGDGAIQVDVNLGRETTLEVVPGSVGGQ